MDVLSTKYFTAATLLTKLSPSLAAASVVISLFSIHSSWVSAQEALVSDQSSLPGDVSPQQKDWYEKYKTQQNVPKPSQMLINTDPEPNLNEGFQSLFNGKDLSGWTTKQGPFKFEVKDGVIEGVCVPGGDSTYLSTERSDFQDFVFTCDIKWKVEGNTGVMFRAQTKQEGDRTIVHGPQAEMEGFSGDRGWSGGVYGQSCGGYYYPLWLKAHQEARSAINKDHWNRITISAIGNVVKTWVNGIPAAHWLGDGTYSKGFFGLQVHKGKEGIIQFKNLKVKELNR